MLSRLGAGGMGEVYLALDTALQRKVALKILPESLRGDEDRLRRFLQEARAASAINHAHIAHIYETGEDAGYHYIAMEYVEGDTLEARFFARKPGADEFRSIVEQTSQALAAAHARGIIHRDLKPTNIMITPEGEVKILDFGLAKLVSEPAQTPPVNVATKPVALGNSEPGVIAGTPQFMSPEQARGQKLDARTDIFSLGAVYYSLWTGGRSPYDAPNAAASTERLLDADPFDLTPVPVEFRAMVGRCLQKDPLKRPSSMRELSGMDEAGRRSVWSRETVLLTLAVCILGAAWVFFHRARSIDSVAVMPFEALQGDTDAGFLSRGICESMIASLTNLRGLRVVSWPAVQHYEGRQVDPKLVASQLGVGGVIMGNVRLRNGRLALGVDLFAGESGRRIWSVRFERSRSEIVNLQDEVAREAAAELRGELNEEDRKLLLQRKTGNSEAYMAYLEARDATRRSTPESMQQGLQTFERAVALDPTYALPYAGKAIAYAYSADWLIPNAEACLRARDYAEHAITLDDQISDAHYALGFYHVFYAHDYERGESEFRHGLALAPGNTANYSFLVQLLALRHQFDDAAKLMDTALKLAPGEARTVADAGWVRYAAHEFPEALRYYDRAKSLAPNSPSVWAGRANVLIALERYREADADLSKARSVDSSLWLLSNVAYLNARSGMVTEARSQLKELLDARDKQLVAATDIAAIYAGLRDRANTLLWLERSMTDHGETVWISIDPQYDFLRDDERFQTILRRLHLPENFSRK